LLQTKRLRIFFAYVTMKKIEDEIIDGWAIGLIADYGAFAVTMCFTLSSYIPLDVYYFVYFIDRDQYNF
jgi:hypothetical protein